MVGTKKSNWWQAKSWFEIVEHAKSIDLAILPVGSIEQHGPHLPTGTDAMIADEVARRTAEALEGKGVPVLVMDTVRYGYSVKAVADWPGTIRLSAETVTNTMREICASLCRMGFRKIAIINSHGNHPGLLEMVSRRVADEHEIDVPIVALGGLAGEAVARYAEGGEGASCHAGEVETSVMLAIRPDLVRTDLYPEGDRVTVHNPGGPGVFWSTWRRQKSKSGTYGVPATASAENGEKFLEAMVQKATEFLVTYYKHPGVSPGT